MWQIIHVLYNRKIRGVIKIASGKNNRNGVNGNNDQAFYNDQLGENKNTAQMNHSDKLIETIQRASMNMSFDDYAAATGLNKEFIFAILKGEIEEVDEETLKKLSLSH